MRMLALDKLRKRELTRFNTSKDRKEVVEFINVMIAENGYHYGAAIASYYTGYDAYTVKTIFKMQKKEPFERELKTTRGSLKPNYISIVPHPPRAINGSNGGRYDSKRVNRRVIGL